MTASKIDIPHFHGINFDDASMTDVEKQKQFFTRLKNGEHGYYNEMGLRNAILKFGEPIPRWKQKILDEYYIPDIGETFKGITREFYTFQQQYVNSYKFGKEKLDKSIQDRISTQPVLRDLWFLSPESASIDTKMDDNREHHTPLKGKRKDNAKEKRDALDAAHKKLEEEYQEGRKDPFVAMSKLPRHAIEFASKSVSSIYNKLDNKTHFIGMVLVSLHTPEDYKKQPLYDVLSNTREGKISVNGHFKFQAEVDFLKTSVSVVFPIIVPDGKAQWTPDIETEFGINRRDFGSLRSALLSKRSNKGLEDEMKSWYSSYIVRSLQEKPDLNLMYLKADGNKAKFTGDVLVMQRDIIDSIDSTKQGEDRAYQVYKLRTVGEYKDEATNNSVEADIAIKESLLTMPGLVEALTNLRLQERNGLEPYETISIDRKIAAENPTLAREQRDGLLAEALEEKESQRRGYFTGIVLGERKIKEEKIIKKETAITI